MLIMILNMKSMTIITVTMMTNIHEIQQRRTHPTGLHTSAWESNSNWCSLHFLNNDDLVSVDTSTLKPKATQLILFSDQSGPLIKKIDGTARDIGESIKDAQEGKSDEKTKSASKFSHLRNNVNH